MASNPLVVAHRAARKYHTDLLRVQRRVLGPRGALAGWNRRWLAEVGQALRQGGLQTALRVHRELRPAFARDVGAWLGAAQAVGEAVGNMQVDAYGLPADGTVPMAGAAYLHKQPNELAAMPAARYDMAGLLLQQVGRYPADEAVQRLEGAKPLDKARHDLAVALPEAATLGVLMWLLGGLAKAGHDPFVDGLEWGKQAVATIDGKTTETCLLVHGQVRPLNKPFRLAGEPKFASRMDWPPFHFHCRTSVVLYNARYDNGLTAQMRAEAARELAARPGSVHPRPSSGVGK